MGLVVAAMQEEEERLAKEAEERRIEEERIRQEMEVRRIACSCKPEVHYSSGWLWQCQLTNAAAAAR